MLGPPKSRRLGEPIAVSLEELAPQDNFCRHLEARLDLSFVRDWVRECYAGRGRPGIDPVVFFKLQLVMFFFYYEARTHVADLFADVAPEASRGADAPASPDEASAEIVRLPTMPAAAGPPAAAPDP